MSRLRRQMSYSASLSTWLVTSVCSRRECTHSTVLYGSTHAEGGASANVANPASGKPLGIPASRPCRALRYQGHALIDCLGKNYAY